MIEKGATFSKLANEHNGLFYAILKFEKYGDAGVEAIRFALAHGIREQGILTRISSPASRDLHLAKDYQAKIVQLLIEFGCKLSD